MDCKARMIGELERAAREDNTVFTKCVMTRILDAWSKAEEEELPNILRELARYTGTRLWQDGWLPSPASLSLVREDTNYGREESICLKVGVTRSDTYRQRLYGLVALCHELAEENEKLKRSFWCRLGRILNTRLWGK
jgi:hypothetical protein